MKRCLIVDGSSVIRKIASRILSGPEMTVQQAATGADAQALCATQMPDVIIIDARLPDRPADIVIRQLRALSTASQPDIFLCMNQFDIGAIMRAKRAGAKGYVLKPFDRSLLLASLRAASPTI